jgi:hypothetical protein
VITLHSTTFRFFVCWDSAKLCGGISANVAAIWDVHHLVAFIIHPTLTSASSRKSRNAIITIYFLFVFTMLFVIGHVFGRWLARHLPLVFVVALGIFSFELGTLVFVCWDSAKLCGGISANVAAIWDVHHLVAFIIHPALTSASSRKSRNAIITIYFLFVFTMLFVIGHVFGGWLTTILPLVIVVALGIFSFELGTLVFLFVVFTIFLVIGHVFITWLAMHLPLVFVVALGIFSFELGTLVRVGFTARDGFFTSAPF